jgi:hypothetical protein
MTASHDQLINWCWQAAEVGGLSALEPNYIAKHHQIPIQEITRFIPDRTYALLLLISEILNQVDIPKNTFPSSEEYLFDTIMLYFDAAQPHRSAIDKIWVDLWWYPLETFNVMSPLTKVINGIVDEAFKDNFWFLQQIYYKAYQLLILDVFITWLHDSSPDLAKTMAKLDHGLKRLQSCRTLFSL